MEKTLNKNKTEIIAVTGVSLALATVLSFIKVWEMPLGGSITLLSMLPMVFLSMRYGVKHGLVSAFLYSLIQLACSFAELSTWGLTKWTWFGAIVFDYIIAFTVLGLAGIWRDKGRVLQILGVVFAMSLRFVSHVISGVIFFGMWMPEEWSNPFIYSICYNGAYMLPEIVLTALVLFSVPRLLKMFKK